MRLHSLHLSAALTTLALTTTATYAVMESFVQTGLTPEVLCASSIPAGEVDDVLTAAADATLVADVQQAKQTLDSLRKQLGELDGLMLSSGETAERTTEKAQLTASAETAETALATAQAALTAHIHAALALETSTTDADLALRMIENAARKVPTEWKCAVVADDDAWAELEEVHAAREHGRQLTVEQSQLLSQINANADVILVRSRLQSGLAPVTGAYVQLLLASAQP